MLRKIKKADVVSASPRCLHDAVHILGEGRAEVVEDEINALWLQNGLSGMRGIVQYHLVPQMLT